jgi:hypothetical protein
MNLNILIFTKERHATNYTLFSNNLLRILEIIGLKNLDREARKQLTQKLLHINDTKSPLYRKAIAELLYSYISKN